MPKKRRHQFKFSKPPQSAAPASLSIAGIAGSSGSQHHGQAGSGSGSGSRSVNELLADLRRSGANSGGHRHDLEVHPTVPPLLRDILQHPETPPPRPRRPVRYDAAGRRLPPGPAPPSSWTSGLLSGLSAQSAGAQQQQSGWDRYALHSPLPGQYLPERGSLIDIVLRRIALDWEFQKSYNRYYLYSLPTHLRVALVTYLGISGREGQGGDVGGGVSLADLRALLLPPVEDEQDDSSSVDGEVNVSEDSSPAADHLPPSEVNNDLHHFDLTGSIGRSLKLRELSDLLSPPRIATTSTLDPKESWDAPDDDDDDDDDDDNNNNSNHHQSAVPRPLLPNLTHLSLALYPNTTSNNKMSISWRHLLAFASHLPNAATLTHLSLAYWPEPSLTPNAKFASFVSVHGRVVQYGGTGPYSHSLDDDWVEAVMVLSRLSRSLYGLEWLDLSGCGGWMPALWESAGHDVVDWVGSWGKVGVVVLGDGGDNSDERGDDEQRKKREREREREVGIARRLERYVRGRRRSKGMGGGRGIEVLI